MMFPFHGAPRLNQHALARMVDVAGHGVSDRVRLVFAATAISTTERDCIDAAAAIGSRCSVYSSVGGRAECLLHGIANLLWSLADYDGNEGRTIRGDDGFDVYRTFYRLKQTKKADCDCFTVSTDAILTMNGEAAGARVIEQKDKSSGEFGWSHIFPFTVDRATGRLIPLELTPVPPDGHRATIGWQTAPTTYRRHLDFIFDREAWTAWVERCDLANGVFAPMPKVYPVSSAGCSGCGLCHAAQ